MTSSFFSYGRLILGYSAWWLLWLILHSYVLYQAGFPPEIACADSLISNVLLALVCFAIGTTLRYYKPEKKNALNVIVGCIALSALWGYTTEHLLSYFFQKETDYLVFLQRTLLLRFCIAFLMVGCVALFNWVIKGIQSQQENEKRKSDAEKLRKEAELAGLRQQLQPHFLFNSLNSISALILTQPEAARKMIHQLSDFLRGTLKKEEQQLVALSEELEHLELYLEIEKVRFGHRLNTVIERDEKSETLLLPSLLLQPVVENAIKFGLYDTIGDITIRIVARSDDNNLTISVENPFDPSTKQPKGTGFGLNSVQRRLYLLYARNDLVQTKSHDHLFTTTLKIPQLR